MSIEQSSFNTLLEDLKVSFKFAWKNIISFVLGMIGVLLVTAILLVVVAAIIFVPLFIALGGFQGMINLFSSITLESFQLTGPLVLSVGVLIMLPFITPLFVAVGALFGMAREIVESAGTTAEGVFVWYKSKFFSFAGSGIVLFTVVLLPVGLLYMAAATLVGPIVTGVPFGIVTGLAVVWLFLSTGMLSMMLPGIIDGLSVMDAFRQSIRLGWDHFDRVFSVWLSFIVIILVMLAPIMGGGIMGSFSPGALGFMAASAVPMTLLLVFLVFPALSIALSRVYMILTGVAMPEEAEEYPNVRMVGGT